jgi:hypothetical protein
MIRLIVSSIISVVISFVLSQYIFSNIFDLFNQSITFNLIWSLFMGIVFFFSFRSMKKDKRFNVKLETNEEIIKQEGANHLKKIEAVGGKLFLFKDYLLFKSHKYNIQKHRLSIPISEIKSFDIYKLFGVFPLGIKIISSNSKEIFFMDKPKEWIQALQASI